MIGLLLLRPIRVTNSVKRLRRLSGWQRIGITASVLWLILGAFWGYNEGHFRGYRAVVQWRIDCILALPVAPPLPLKNSGRGPIKQTPATQQEWDNATPLDSTMLHDDGVPSSDIPIADQNCIQRSNQLWPEVLRLSWKYAALFAFVPIALGWPTAYGIIALVRWIRNWF